MSRQNKAVLRATAATARAHDGAASAACRQSQKGRIRYSAIVFAGGACYGIIASVVKIAYGAHFTFQQVVCSQAVFAFLVFAVINIAGAACGRSHARLDTAQRVKLAAMGLVTAGTTTFYYLSLEFIPASVAITLLFQFTWMGLVFEAVATRTAPAPTAVIAALVIFAGTLFASGFVGKGDIGSLHPLGILCGLAAAFCCASFMYLSGHVEAHLPVSQRGLWASCGYLLIGFALCPDYLTSGALGAGIWQFGLILGPLGFAVPMLLFGIACKHLPAGLSTIMASSELPISIACSIFVLKEAVTPLQIAGVAAILLGVGIAQIPSQPAQKRTERVKDTAI